MSILITGMEMPTSCGFCPLRYESDIGDACSADINVSTQYQTRPEDCPLAPVPKHGRTIDADALEYHADNVRDPMGRTEKTVMWSKIQSAPTIIPASGGQEDE